MCSSAQYRMLIAWFLCFAAAILQPPKAPPLFVSENAFRGQFTFTDGVIGLKGGRGWMRTPRLYSNFQLSLEFRAVTADADAALVLRTLVSEGQMIEPAYRVALPQLLSLSPTDALRDRKNSIQLVKEGRIDPGAADAWQRLDVVAHLNEITITLNDNLVGVYEVESFTGYILFTSRKGHLELRNFMAKDAEPTFIAPGQMLTYKELQAAGGTAPKLRREVKPFYTLEALHQRKIAGVVWMEAVVLPDGTIGSVRVTRTLDPDLDQSAVASVRRWAFAPGMLNGSAVPVLVEVQMSFTIRR